MAESVSDGAQTHGHSQAGAVYHPPACTGAQSHGHVQAGAVALTTLTLELTATHYGDTIDKTTIHYDETTATAIHVGQVDVSGKASS